MKRTLLCLSLVLIATSALADFGSMLFTPNGNKTVATSTHPQTVDMRQDAAIAIVAPTGGCLVRFMINSSASLKATTKAVTLPAGMWPLSKNKLTPYANMSGCGAFRQ